jgi:hypothetical protein
VGPVDLLEQNHARELMRERDLAERQPMVDVLELQPEWSADHEAEILAALAPRLEELAEADRVDLLPGPIEQRDEQPLRDAPADVVVLAHLDQLELDVTRKQLLVVLDIVGERRAQPPDGDDEDPHDARYYVSMEDPGRPERHINIHFSPDIMAGVYANFANVSHSDYEFTITFARVDHEVEDDEIPGVVVSRINLSARFMRELIDAMQDNYSKWQTREGIKNLPEYGGGQDVDEASE